MESRKVVILPIVFYCSLWVVQAEIAWRVAAQQNKDKFLRLRTKDGVEIKVSIK